MRNIQHIHFETIDSTHIYARNNLQNLQINEWYLYTASKQEAGIGTKNRTWISPCDVNIYATYSFFLEEKNMSKIFYIPQITCLQVANLLLSIGVDAKIKWINDVLVNRRKISGVLCESVSNVAGRPGFIAVIVSVGLNVNSSLHDLQGVEQIATSIKIETNKKHEVQKLLMQLSSLIFNGIHSLMELEFAEFQPAISAKLERFGGKKIVLQDSEDSDVDGIIKDIGDQGELILETVDGEKAYFQGSIIAPVSNL